MLIIGILAAVALPQYNKAVIKTRYTNLKTLVRAVANAEETYYLANNSYTNSFDELDVQMQTPLSSTDENERLTYLYSWGYCFLQSASMIMCKSHSANMRYGIWFNHSAYAKAGKQQCEVDNNNAYAHQICKQESGLTTHTGGAPANGNYEYAW